VPGGTDRTLRFVIEGSLQQAQPASGQQAGAPSTVLSPGCMVGEDALFAEGPGRLDVRTLEDALVLELPWPRQAELTAAHRGIAFELLRAAGAVIAARVGMLMAREASPAN
jgi:CRP-like cAMP-binding protein